MGYQNWLKVLGKALDDGAFCEDLAGKLRGGSSNAQIKTFVKNRANVSINNEDVEWLKRGIDQDKDGHAANGRTFLDMINAGRHNNGMNGGSGRG